MKQRGFTLIEVLIVGAIACIALLILVFVISGMDQGHAVSFGVNGAVEQRCVGGYLHVVGSDGSVRQVMSELGHGVRCQ